MTSFWITTLVIYVVGVLGLWFPVAKHIINDAVSHVGSRDNSDVGMAMGFGFLASLLFPIWAPAILVGYLPFKAFQYGLVTRPRMIERGQTPKKLFARRDG